jgi:ribonuclease HI
VESHRKVIIHSDGGCRKSGESVCGASITTPEGVEIATVSLNLGPGTNNTAEYLSAIYGLRKAIELGAKEVDLFMDSQLVVRQVTGEYTVTKNHLKPYFKELKAHLGLFRKWTVNHIKREFNKRADELANLAYSKKEGSA